LKGESTCSELVEGKSVCLIHKQNKGSAFVCLFQEIMAIRIWTLDYNLVPWPWPDVVQLR